MLATAEKGVGWARLRARGTAGHASRPSRDNAVVSLARAVSALGEHELYARLQRGRLISVAAGRHDALNDRSHRSVAASVVQFLERLRKGSALPPQLPDEPDGAPAAAPLAPARLCAQAC